jgi:hypothetical protein
MSSTAESTQGMRLLAAAEAGEDLGQRLEQLNAIGASLSAERDINRLLESILTAAKTITRGRRRHPVPRHRGKDAALRDRAHHSLAVLPRRHHRHAGAFLPDHLIGKDGKPNHGMVAPTRR